MLQTRNTLAAPLTLEGTGLFTNAHCSITLTPALPDSGIRFTARHPEHATLAHANALTSAVAHAAFTNLPPRCTSIDLISSGGSTHPLFTIEHLLSALVGCAVHDCLITVAGPEIPILDGSALDFVNAIHAVGLTSTNAPINPVTISQSITVEDARGGSVTIAPADSDAPTYSYRLDYGPNVGTDSPLKQATATWDGSPEQYTANIAPARTFCLLAEAEQMQKLGLFKDLTERDLLVIGDHGPINNTFRFPDEPARHKLLDLIGDLALVGGPLLANVTAIKSGHALHHRAAQAILDSLA